MLIVLADDFSRVTLPAIAGVEGSDYINACYIDVSSLPVTILCMHITRVC